MATIIIDFIYTRSYFEAFYSSLTQRVEVNDWLID